MPRSSGAPATGERRRRGHRASLHCLPQHRLRVAWSDAEAPRCHPPSRGLEMSGASGTGVAPAQRYVPVCQLGGSFCVDGPDSTRVSESGTRLVTGTDFVTQPVQDYEAASKFYGETLGLEFSKRWGKMPAGEFETGSLTIALMQPEAFGMEFAASRNPIEFHVDDFEGARAELIARGVEFRGETLDSGVCWQAFFEDPDGNTLAIHHRYAPAE